MKHLEEMKEEIRDMKIEELIYLIRKKDISIKDEDTIWEIVKERLKELKREKKNRNERKMRRILLENIQIKYLNKLHFQEYIEEIEGEDIIYNSTNNYIEGGNIWNQIQTIILNNMKNIKLKENQNQKEKDNWKLIEHKGKNFEGIIKYLENKHGNNIHQNGIITPNSSSTYSTQYRQKAINYEDDDYWESTNNQGEWWGINFKKMKIKMNGYSLQSPRNGHHLKNWIIEGKNEGENWKEIHRHVNNNDLKDDYSQHYYSLPELTDSYQIFRIRSIGKNTINCQYICIDKIEIFGEILEI